MRTVDVSRILAVKLADLGDLLLCQPALQSLHEGYPDAQIDILTTPQAVELLALMDQRYQAVAFPKELFDERRTAMSTRAITEATKLAMALRRRQYDLIVVFHHLTTQFGAAKFRVLVSMSGARRSVGLDNGRGAFYTESAVDFGFGMKHEADYMLDIARQAGGSVVSPPPKLDIAHLRSGIRTPERFVVLFPSTGSYSRAREWPKHRYGHLARRLFESGFGIVVVGAADATEAAQVIQSSVPRALDLTGTTSISDLAYVVSRAAIVVGGDSFVGHLAAAVGTPVVSIFGPTNQKAWKPYASVDVHKCGGDEDLLGYVVHAGLPCSPCLYTGYRLGRPGGCPLRSCLSLVTVDDVAGVVTKVVGANK